MVSKFLKFFIFIFFFNLCLNEINSIESKKCANCDVLDLKAESNYRTVKLSWNYFNDQDPIGFNVKSCELSVWNTNVRCREKLLKLSSNRIKIKSNLYSKINSPVDSNNDNLNNQKNQISSFVQPVQSYDKLIRKNKNHYEALIYDLRTLTNYTFQVTAMHSNTIQQLISTTLTNTTNLSSIQTLIKQNLKDKVLNSKTKPYNGNFIDNAKSVQIETKGFSARTSRCLSNVSDVIVNTGPLFNGKISVENTSSDECAVYGDRSYNQESYHLTILHDKCGSRIMNNSRIETMIIVHENKDILTHNARRFLVVCNFLPESYTLKASVAMPTNLLKRKFNDQNPNQSTLYSVSKVSSYLDSNNSTNLSNLNKPLIINNKLKPNRNHPGTLQEQFIKQKQQYLNKLLINNRLTSNSDINNNEVVYNYERLAKNNQFNVRDSRQLLTNQPQHSIVHNTYRERQNTEFSNIFTMIMIAVGSICLFVIIIFNFISIPKIWNNQHVHHRRKKRHHSTNRNLNKKTDIKRYQDYYLSENRSKLNIVSITDPNLKKNNSKNAYHKNESLKLDLESNKRVDKKINRNHSSLSIASTLSSASSLSSTTINI